MVPARDIVSYSAEAALLYAAPGHRAHACLPFPSHEISHEFCLLNHNL